MKTRTIFFSFLIFASSGTFAQSLPEKGMPKLENFTPIQYKNKGKIWDICSAPNGIVYMAADKGLLEYDGKKWNSYKGSDGFIRSLLLANDSLIYTGSDLDFGVWEKNKYQAFEYRSLYPFQKDIQDINEEFWDVHQIGDKILFVSSRNVYIYKNQQLTKIAAPYKFSGSFIADDSLYFADEKSGLYVFTGLSLKQVFPYPDDRFFEISGLYNIPQGLVVVTKNMGLFLYSSGTLRTLYDEFSRNLKTAKVFSFEKINGEHLAFGTVLEGLYITDMDGNIIHHITKQKGLPNNTILSLHYSPAGKLWLGMDYGVSSLNLKNNLTWFYDYMGDFGTSTSALMWNGVFYLGTNQGVYRSEWNELNNDADYYSFQLIPGTEGQVWTLDTIDNTLFIGHDLGLFITDGKDLQKVSDQHGVWTLLPYNDYFLTGNYNGISIFRKSGGNWTFFKKMELILGSCNQLVMEKDSILWVNIPNFGIIRAALDKDIYPNDRVIFPDSLFEGSNLSLVKNNNDIHIITDTYQYTFNALENKFIQNSDTVVNCPVVENLLPGVYRPAPLHPHYEFYPVFNGFALKYLKSRNEKKTEIRRPVLRKMYALNNEEKIQLYSGAEIPYRLNNLEIDWILPNQDNVLYQYKLNNEGTWSSWQPDNLFEFLGLKEGEHTLFVRAFYKGIYSDPGKMSFRIAPPWYRTWYAYAAYILFIGIVAFIIRYWQKISLKKQKKDLLIKQRNSLNNQAEKFKQEITLLEQERMKIEYNQMKQQLRNKTIELAKKARDNEDKNRLLLSLKEKCDKYQSNPDTANTGWRDMQRVLDSYLKEDDKTFEIQMDELHQEFFKKLKDQFPDLSNNDLRFCAYIKIGLNSKEIADILNIQPSSTYISRSRLRKKLKLGVDEDLYDFLISI